MTTKLSRRDLLAGAGAAAGALVGADSAGAGRRSDARAVDLATLPLFVRAGAVLPLGPVKQYTAEPNDAP